MIVADNKQAAAAERAAVEAADKAFATLRADLGRRAILARWCCGWDVPLRWLR